LPPCAVAPHHSSYPTYSLKFYTPPYLLQSFPTRRSSDLEFLTLINRLEMSFPSGEELIDDHYELVDAIRSGEPLRGVSLIENHLKSAASRLRTRFKTTEQEI